MSKKLPEYGTITNNLPFNNYVNKVKDVKKKRNFKGAWRNGYGPVNAPKVVDTDITGGGMMTTTGYGSSDPVSTGDVGGGDAGGVMESFNGFVDSMKIDSELKSTVLSAYSVIYGN